MKAEEKIVEILDAKVVQKSNEAQAEWRLLELENSRGETREEWRPFLLGPDGRVMDEPKWMPLPGSQQLFLQCPVFETLYHGNRGPGKTLSLIMDYARGVGQGYGSAWRGILFRRFFGDLDDVVRKIEEWYGALFPGFRFLRSKSEYAALFPGGEVLLLRHLRDETEYPSFHGHEYPWQGFEELTEWEDDKAYKLMFSCCRPPKPGVPCRIRSTANPYGPGHCVPFGEVLTPDRGWVDIRAMQPGDAIISMDQDGRAFETKISDVIEEHYAGDMIHREGRGLSMVFTENHRLPKIGGNRQNTGDPSTGRRHNLTLTPFCELPGQAVIKRTVDSWEGKSYGWFRLRETPDRRKLRRPQPLVLTGRQYAALMGWFLSEGHVVDRDKAFGISQVKPKTRAKLVALLDECGFDPCWGPTGATIYSESWWRHLRKFGKCRDKWVPVRIKRAKTEILRAFFDAAMDGDGHWAKAGSGAYYTTSARLADDMSEIAVKLGYSVYVRTRQRENREGPSYEVHFANRDTVQLLTGNHCYRVNTSLKILNVERRPFSGKVYCVTVPGTETFLIRQNGCVWLSGNSWVKKRFQLPDMSGHIIQNPGEDPRVAIRGSIGENFLLLDSEPNYPKRIRQAAKNPAQAKAWLEGDWNVTSGGMFDDLWSPKHHIVPNINAAEIPKGWRVDRAYDHGQSHPFAVGWWLESNGEPIEIDGKVIGGVRGDLILMAEWYGSTGAANEGVRMSAKDIAQGILDREQDLDIAHRVEPGPADTEIFNAHVDRDARSPADDMEQVGVVWERANKSPGSRKRGWEMIRTLLKNAVPNSDGSREEPGLFVCERCRWWLDLVPPMPRDVKDPDETPEKYEDHNADMTRYRITYDPPTAGRRSF